MQLFIGNLHDVQFIGQAINRFLAICNKSRSNIAIVPASDYVIVKHTLHAVSAKELKKAIALFKVSNHPFKGKLAGFRYTKQTKFDYLVEFFFYNHNVESQFNTAVVLIPEQILAEFVFQSKDVKTVKLENNGLTSYFRKVGTGVEFVPAMTGHLQPFYELNSIHQDAEEKFNYQQVFAAATATQLKELIKYTLNNITLDVSRLFFKYVNLDAIKLKLKVLASVVLLYMGSSSAYLMLSESGLKQYRTEQAAELKKYFSLNGQHQAIVNEIEGFEKILNKPHIDMGDVFIQLNNILDKETQVRTILIQGNELVFYAEGPSSHETLKKVRANQNFNQATFFKNTSKGRNDKEIFSIKLMGWGGDKES